MADATLAFYVRFSPFSTVSPVAGFGKRPVNQTLGSENRFAHRLETVKTAKTVVADRQRDRPRAVTGQISTSVSPFTT